MSALLGNALRSIRMRFHNALPVLLALSGLTMVSAGIGMIFLPAGVIAGGVSALVLHQGAVTERGGRE